MQTAGKYDKTAKVWIIKAATKGGIVIAALVAATNHLLSTLNLWSKQMRSFNH